MEFWFGTYDSGRYWHQGQFQEEVDINLRVLDEVWARYGHRPAFKGWYLSQEVSRRTGGIIDIYARMGRHCKEISGNLPTLISPWIQGVKAVSAFTGQTRQAQGITLEEHEREWNEIMAGIAGAVDIVAFQDGHVEFDELASFLSLNKALAERRLLCWTNSESFDRDMPIKFPPIKWEKLLEAERGGTGMEKAITFEFSHFMSPNSIYRATHISPALLRAVRPGAVAAASAVTRDSPEYFEKSLVWCTPLHKRHRVFRGQCPQIRATPGRETSFIISDE